MTNVRQIRPAKTSGEEVALEIDDTQALRALTEGGHLPALLILSKDPQLIDTARKSAPHGTPVTHAADLDSIADKLPELEPGVLLVDIAGTNDIAAMLTQLAQHFPEMVAVVAGQREDSGKLMRLTAEGRVFRFLLTPLTLGQARLALRAAAAQHIELKASSARRVAVSDDGGNKKNYLATYGALAAGLILAVAGVWFVVSKLTSEPSAPVAVQTPATKQQPSALEQKPDPVEAEIALAQEAFAADRYLEPRGESALDFYRAALALDANSDVAKRGVRSIADKVLEIAEADVTAERLEAAIGNIEKARDIDPTHPRLAFLDTQIARERERLKLTQARGLGNRVRTLVTASEGQIARGRLIAPASDNARDSLIAARKADPTDPLVVQSIRGLVATLTDEARKALAAGRLRDAQAYVDSTRALGSAGDALFQIERQLADVTARPGQSANEPASRSGPAAPSGPNVDALINEARQRIANGALVEPVGASAKDSLAALRSAAPNRPEVDELSRTIATRLLESSKQANAQQALERSAQLIASAREIGGAGVRDAASAAELDLAAARERRALEPIVATSLPRTREVPVEYPRQALLAGTEGWVDLEFTIQPDGVPTDVKAANAKPKRTFDRAAIEALRQWRFQPIVRDGVPVAQRATLRMQFVKE